MIASLPRRAPPVIVGLILVTLVASIVAAVDSRGGGNLYNHLALLPSYIWDGELWRLATWILVESAPIALVSGCISLYWFGGDLVDEWGTARFVRFAAAVVLVAGAGTSVLALALDDVWQYPHLGGVALGSALVIVWALLFPDRRVRVYMVLEVGGPLLAYGTVAITVLFAIFYGIAFVLPELLAEATALAYIRFRRVAIRSAA
jgi:membrane associated rhomboid family serine protease